MPNKNKVRGSNFEREVVNLFKDAGFIAWRVPYSGAMANYKGDVRVRHGTKELEGECKVKKSGFKFIYEALGLNDFLVVIERPNTPGGIKKENKKVPLVVLSVDKFMELITHEKEKQESIG